MRRRQLYALRAEEEKKAREGQGPEVEAPPARATASIEPILKPVVEALEEKLELSAVIVPKKAGRPKKVKHGDIN